MLIKSKKTTTTQFLEYTINLSLKLQSQICQKEGNFLYLKSKFLKNPMIDILTKSIEILMLPAKINWYKEYQLTKCGHNSQLNQKIEKDNESVYELQIS